MIHPGKINVKTLAGIIVYSCLLLISMQVSAGKDTINAFGGSLTVFLDTVPAIKKNIAKDSLKINKDSLAKQTDSTNINKIDTLTISKDSLDAPVNYIARDSGVLMIATKEFILYGKSNVKYTDMTLDADVIKYDQQSQMIRAYGTLDTTNNPQNKPTMKQGEMKSIMDSISFNMKSMKALTQNTYYNEGELFVNAKVLKKVSKDVFYGYGAVFTTCNLDTPHFAIRTRKIKMINNKIAVSGPASPEFEGVPVPIGIPFGIYPLQRGRHSGILVPTFNASQDFGFGLEGLGYYKVVNENLDVTVRSNIYTYGGWSLNISPKYLKRYRYTGSLNVTFQNTVILNQTGTSPNEFTSTKSYMINWSHNRDNKARPGSTFNASVNFGSSKYNQSLVNNPTQNYMNQLNSSISYTKDFRGKANFSMNLNANQNSVTRLVNLNLPTASLNVVTKYPFQKAEKVGTPKWYENIGIGYSGNVQNLISYYDTAGVSFKRLLDTLQWGATHSIPISLTLPQIGAITLSPSVSYQENWYGQKIFRSWDSVNSKVDTLVSKGLYTSRQMSFGMSASTRIFGTYSLKNAKIRHEVRPTFSISYKPDLAGKYFYSTKVDTAGHYLRFSQFDGVIPGAFSEGAFGGMSFGIDNLLEMKVKDKTDSTGKATKKVKLIDGFGFNSSYNLMADSFALSPFNFYARSTLFEKVNITASAILDPYAVDSMGFRKNELMWKSGKLGRLTNGNIAISTSFKSKPKEGKADKDRIPVDPFMTPDEQQRQLQYARANPAEFTDFNIPWSVNLSYSLSFSKQLQANTTGYTYITQVYSTLMAGGDFSLTEKWKMGGNGYFDFNVGKLQMFTMFITREMHCWQLAINVTPIGLYRSFSITLNPKSGILRDLKINRSRSYSNY